MGVWTKEKMLNMKLNFLTLIAARSHLRQWDDHAAIHFWWKFAEFLLCSSHSSRKCRDYASESCFQIFQCNSHQYFASVFRTAPTLHQIWTASEVRSLCHLQPIWPGSVWSISKTWSKFTWARRLNCLLGSWNTLSPSVRKFRNSQRLCFVARTWSQKNHNFWM